MTRLSSFFSKCRTYAAQAEKWLESDTGYRYRVRLIFGTVVAYPLGVLFLDGPFLSLTFTKRYNIDYDLPKHLQKTIEEQTLLWLEQQGRHNYDTHVAFSCQNNAKYPDTVTRGSSFYNMGAQVALPFFARFQNAEEAMEYCKKHFEPFNFMGQTVCVLWDSDFGQKLLDTMVLSKEAISFLISRDLYAVDKRSPLFNKIICWLCWSICSCIFVLVVHGFMCKGSLLSFLVSYPIFAFFGAFGSLQWHYLWKFQNDKHADFEAGRLSEKHWEGGKEYYLKMVVRNKLLRELLEDKSVLTRTGDVNDLKTTPFLTRLDGLMDVKPQEGTDLIQGYAGDDTDLDD